MKNSQTDRKYQIREAAYDDIPAILSLFSAEVSAGLMLPRDPENMKTNIKDWIVAEEGNQIVGCVSLVFFNQELCEIRSLAVASHYRRNGLGSTLVSSALDLARIRGMRRVLTLTRSAGLFEHLAFQRDLIHNYPEKVWQDCQPCPFKQNCDEVALTYHLEREESGNGIS
jgi:amino-acid N-acetyltransferase